MNQELNFSSPDNSIVIKGGCDLFTTKPIGLDRKLFKTIDKHVDQILADNLYLRLVERERRRSSSVGPSSENGLRRGSFQFRRASSTDPQTTASLRSQLAQGLNGSTSELPGLPEHAMSLSVDTICPLTSSDLDELPFGPLKESTTRKTFAYLVAILNSTFPDHDFSNLQPSTENFHRIPRAETFIKRVNNLLTSLGKKEDTLNWIWDTINSYMDMIPPRAGGQPVHTPTTSHPSNQSRSRHGSSSLQALAGALASLLADYGPELCQIYQFQPSDEAILQDLSYPYQAMWSYYWFIYNKKKKRVCFVTLRAINKLHYSVVNNTKSQYPTLASTDVTGAQGRDDGDGDDDDDEGIDDNMELYSDEYADSNDIVGDIEM